MTVVYILAHFDDEYCAMPLLRHFQRAGLPQRFFYVSDYAQSEVAATRLAESRRLLSSLGLDPNSIDHVGLGTGVLDGSVHRGLGKIYDLLADRLASLGRISGLVTPAWEGGHVDHDMCALLSTQLAASFNVPVVQQFSLYNGKGLRGPLFRAAAPLVENGPLEKIPYPFPEILQWAGQVRYFPSQISTWVGLWPVMFASLLHRGFSVQRLDPARVMERPHFGPLLYERMYSTSYDDVRQAADVFFRSHSG